MVHPECLSCRVGIDTAADGLACFGVADCFAGVTGAVVAASDKGADSLSDTGVVGVMVGVGAGTVGACGTAVLGAVKSCGSGSSGVGCTAMWHSLR